MNNEMVLKHSLQAGVVYFLCISMAHVLGIKVPGLYIYYNIESLQYQDQIISFLAFGWASFFFTASRVREAVPLLLVSCIAALLGLANINLSNDFSFITDGASVTPHWFQYALLVAYVGWLVLFYLQSNKTGEPHGISPGNQGNSGSPL